MIRPALACVLAGILGFGSAELIPDAPHERQSDCIAVAAPESDEVYTAADYLVSRGWTGDPSDGAERLYSPECDRVTR